MDNSTIGQVFITATKEKYRFLFNGVCTIEHLWDMTFRDLDFIYRELEEGLNAVQVPGLLKNQSDKTTQEIIKNKLSIIEFIFNSKVEQEKTAEKAALKAQQNQRILAIIAKKKDVELGNMSVEELEKLIV